MCKRVRFFHQHHLESLPYNTRTYKTTDMTCRLLSCPEIRLVLLIEVHFVIHYFFPVFSGGRAGYRSTVINYHGIFLGNLLI